MLSDDQKTALISKDIRAILLNQPAGRRSYEEALQKQYGQTFNTSNMGQSLKRKTEQAQRAVRDLALLAESLPAERFAAVFATEEFIHLIRAVLGAAPFDERSKILSKKLEQSRQSLLEYLDGDIRDYDNAIKSKRYKELRDQYKGLDIARRALDEVKPIAFDPLKAEIASEVAKGALDCCVEQYKHAQKNPVTIGLYEDSIRKAVSIVDAMVTEIRDNVEQVNLLREFQEYKAKKANKKKRSKRAS